MNLDTTREKNKTKKGARADTSFNGFNISVNFKSGKSNNCSYNVTNKLKIKN